MSVLSDSSPKKRRARIAINALSSTAGGGLSVARNLASHLASICPDWDFFLFVSHQGAIPEAAPPNLRVRREPKHLKLLHRWFWEQVKYAAIEADESFDATLLLGGFTSFRAANPQIAVWQNANIWSPGSPEQSVSVKASTFLRRQMMRRSTQLAAQNIFLTQDSITACSRTITLRQENCRVIPIGAEDVFFEERDSRPRTDRAHTLLAVGNLYPHKRFELAIEALASLSPAHPELRLNIAGREIDPDYAGRLRETASRLGVKDRVEFLGGVSTSDLIQLYQDSQIYLVTSRLETFGLTPIEAMACGLPVVACRESATPEVCGDAATYFNVGDRSISQEIDTLLRNEDRWSAQETKGLAHARRYSWRKIALEYADLIRELLGESRAE